MKKIVIILLTVLILLSAAACGRDEDSIHEPIHFYYCNDTISYHSVNAVISAEVRERADAGEDLKAVLNLYLAGPCSEDHISPFPTGVRLESLSQSNGIVSVVLSEAFASLKGLDQTVACACLAKTVLDYTNCNGVKIFTQDPSADKGAYIFMDRDSLLLLDDSF